MIEHLLSAGDRLLVRFTRRADRWEHAVEFRSDDGSTLRWHSEEGTAIDGESWPPSPPFQSLELHDEPDGRRFALLVGMAGSSHWSASVEADSLSETVVFDVACRVKMEPAWLGSSYVRTPHPRPLSRKGRGEAELIPTGGKSSESYFPLSPGGRGVRGEGECVADQLHFLTIAPPGEVGSQAIVETTNGRTIVRVADLAGPLPRTVRWKYVVQVGSLA